MISPLDVLRTANEFIKQHGDDAEIECAVRVDALLAEGDIHGYLVMKRVYDGIIELRRQERRAGESVN